MEYKKFYSILSFNEESDRFQGSVVGASRHLQFAGRSVAELRQNFAQVIEHHLEECDRQGVEPYEFFAGRILLRLRPEEHRDAVLGASIRGVSLNKWLIEAIQAKLLAERPRNFPTHRTRRRSQKPSSAAARQR